MSDTQIFHDTLLIEREFQSPVEALFQAFADPNARARWGVPSPTAVLIFDESNFEIGGKDVQRCGAKDDPLFLVEAVYLDIKPNERIVYSERVSMGDATLSGALHTLEFSATKQGSALKATTQVAAMGDEEMLADTRSGFGAALDNLSCELGEEK